MTPNLAAPTSYVAGTITVAPGAVVGLLRLIQEQLDKNCPGGPREFSISVSAGGIYIGAASASGGPLSVTNFAQTVMPGETKTYTSGYPGSQAPLGNLQVLTTGTPSTIHIEVIA